MSVEVHNPVTIPPAGNLQIVFVNKDGNDTTGTGSFDKPFLTVQAALNSITDNASTKRYDIELGPGEYADPFQIKPWTSISGPDSTSGFYGVTEITAPADTCGLDASFNNAPYAVFSVCWMTNIVFANHQTYAYATPAHPQITLNETNFNSGALFTGDGTSGTANVVMDDCLVFGGLTCQGWQFLWTFGGTQFLGGTVLIQSAANAGALTSTTWLAQDTAIGATYSPTNVTCKWAAPTPVGVLAKLDFCAAGMVGNMTIDGAHTSVAATAGGIPLSVTRLNAAPAPILKTDATGLGYTPGTPGNWVAPVPTTIQQALDRIAAVVSVGGATPIP